MVAQRGNQATVIGAVPAGLQTMRMPSAAWPKSSDRPVRHLRRITALAVITAGGGPLAVPPRPRAGRGFQFWRTIAVITAAPGARYEKRDRGIVPPPP